MAYFKHIFNENDLVEVDLDNPPASKSWNAELHGHGPFIVIDVALNNASTGLGHNQSLRIKTEAPHDVWFSAAYFKPHRTQKND